jgi:hypothetical protein
MANGVPTNSVITNTKARRPVHNLKGNTGWKKFIARIVYRVLFGGVNCSFLRVENAPQAEYGKIPSKPPGCNLHE